MAQLTDFGKAVKKKLIDLDKPQSWLIEQVTKNTGRFCDSSRLAKILSGSQRSITIESAIKLILDLKEDSA